MTSPAERMFDATCRIEKLIYIPGAITDEAFPDDFKSEFIEKMPEDKDAALYAALPALKRFALSDEYPDALDIAETLMSTTGFLMLAATPVMRPYGGGSACSYSWGYYHTEWLYAKDEAAIADVIVAWAESKHERDKAKAGEEEEVAA
jgi:hypothetical protein